MKIVLLGAGGHGREVGDIIRECRLRDDFCELVGYIDDDPGKHGGHIDGIPVLGGFAWFDSVDKDEIFVICAVGTPQAVKGLSERACALGLKFTRAVSPYSSVSSAAHIGNGVNVFANAVINAGVTIGDHTSVNVAATVSHDSVVGDYCSINPGAHIAGNVSIGTECYIGMGANVIQNISIGSGSTVGAGAVVVRDVPPQVTVVGVPARLVQEKGSF